MERIKVIGPKASRIGLVVAALVASSMTAAASAGIPQHLEAPGLTALAGKRILLANDDSVQAAKADGSDGRGLFTLRRALCQAGADVVVVGPWAQQSGRSRATAASPQVSVAPPTATPIRFAGDCAFAPSRGLVLGACQGADPCGPATPSVTPADAVDLALGALVADRTGWTDGPDLVLTGTNAGANTDLAVNLSGTVGAATAAVERGVPAVAVSAGTRATSVPSDATYQATASYVTGLIARMFATGMRNELVRERTLLNVNCPDVGPGVPVTPARWTQVGHAAAERFSYARSGSDSYRLTFGPVQPAPAPEPGSDAATLANGHISVSAVGIDRGRSGVASRLHTLVE